MIETFEDLNELLRQLQGPMHPQEMEQVVSGPPFDYSFDCSLLSTTRSYNPSSYCLFSGYRWPMSQNFITGFVRDMEDLK
jgi:hypothetical protein